MITGYRISDHKDVSQYALWNYVICIRVGIYMEKSVKTHEIKLRWVENKCTCALQYFCVLENRHKVTLANIPFVKPFEYPFSNFTKKPSVLFEVSKPGGFYKNSQT